MATFPAGGAGSARALEADVDPRFPARWSPRSFLSEPLGEAQVAALFEAARWAPSCFNEQPWLFVYGTRAEDRARIAALLVEANRVWAARAPLLGVSFARRRFSKNDAENRWAGFDTGAAALSVALQANAMGLYAHFMGGFDRSAAYEALDVPEEHYAAMAAFAVGKRGAPGDLPAELAVREAPNARKPLAQVAWEGTFRGPI